MKITDVKIFKIKQRGALLGYANVIFDNSFIIRGIKILENERIGRFVAMPSRRLRDGERHFRDVCHPLNSDIRTKLTEAVFEAYKEFIENEE